MEIEQILKRLAWAREQAGLTQGQAGKLVGLKTAGFSDMERGDSPLTVERFLQLCKVYDVSPVWALTGVNPAFNAQEVAEALQRTKVSIEDFQSIMSTLESSAGLER